MQRARGDQGQHAWTLPALSRLGVSAPALESVGFRVAAHPKPAAFRPAGVAGPSGCRTELSGKRGSVGFGEGIFDGGIGSGPVRSLPFLVGEGGVGFGDGLNQVGLLGGGSWCS